MTSNAAPTVATSSSAHRPWARGSRRRSRGCLERLARNWTDDEALEDRFKANVGREHAVAVSNRTAALFLGLHALNLRPGDEVITTPLTCAATLNVIEHP